ncbi:MAG: heterodisulfide reductase-related iron-sulfur binding cluster [Acidimicrobiales bacterium]
MTTTYDPHEPSYHDEGDLRQELTRVYDLCHGCRLCWNLCPSFSSLFELIDANNGEAAALSGAEQDRVVHECYQCKLCYLKCPYVPPHEWQLDFPRLMLRASAVEHDHRKLDVQSEFLGRTDLLGKVGSAAAPLFNRLNAATGSLVRRAMEQTLGIAAQRVLPPYARERFSTWWRGRPRRPLPEADRKGAVTLFTTCLVEYQDPTIGHDLVKVYERNGIDCEVATDAVCCGMPWLDGGDVDAFLAQASRNVGVLADAVRAGRDVVVPQPTCGYVLKREYREYLGGQDAALVADHTWDAAEYLMKRHREDRAAGGEGLDTGFVEEERPESVTWHAACHLRAQSIGYKSRDLMKLTGAEVTVVDRCSGIDGTWGYRRENYELARKVARPLVEAVRQQSEDAAAAGRRHVVAGDCHLANGAIAEETGARPVHPIQVLARAYGIPPEPSSRPDDRRRA